jgi:hypothetical protein
MSAVARTPHAVIISDGSASPLDREMLDASLTDDADVVESLAGIPVIATAARCGVSTARLTQEIEELPIRIAAVFLTRSDPVRARTVQRAVERAGGPPVITDEDAVAIALAATAVSYLNHLGRNLHRCRVLIADAIRMPILAPLLLATGIFDITLWNDADGLWFPLRRAARDADAVIDLRHDHRLRASHAEMAGFTELGLDRPEGSVITARGLDVRTLIVPGLLRALMAPAGDAPAPPPELGINTYRICVHALARARPWRGSSPQPCNRVVAVTAARAIADAVATTLRPNL